MKKRKARRIVLSIILVAIFLSLPCLFRIIFYGESNTTFLGFLTSTMSVEFWGSFWISYISLGATAFLTYQAFNLSIRLGENQDLQQMETDRLKFGILRAEIIGCNRGLRVYFPVNIISVKSLTIESAQLSFGGGELLLLNLPEIQGDLKESSLDFMYPEHTKDNEAYILWFENPYTQSVSYRTAVLTIKFKYEFISCLYKNDDLIVCSLARIAVSLDKDKIEHIVIEDFGVYTPEITSASGKDQKTE